MNQQQMMQQQQMMMQQQQQQQPATWMQAPSGTGLPPGLDYLSKIDQLLVKQKIELFEVFSGIEMENKYVIKNSMGQQIFYAKEDCDFCTRQCVGASRPFTMDVTDNQGNKVIFIERPYKCLCYGQCFSCSKCCQDMVKVQAPVGKTVGYVKQDYGSNKICYKIYDSDKKTILRIVGPGYCSCFCPGQDIPFDIMSEDGSVQVGAIKKQWGNFFKEWFTDADNFGVTFPMDLNVEIKAVLLAAVFLIDFMFFETSGKNNNSYY